MKEELISSSATAWASETLDLNVPVVDGNTNAATLLLRPQHSQQPRHHLYFAYGSNLSYSQMRQRCIHDPDISSKPVALARLDGWKWLICERGYANVDNNNNDNRTITAQVDGVREEESKEDVVVYGVLYNMTEADESELDGYEGIDRAAPRAPENGPVDRKTRPREQGSGEYNKWYIHVTVTKWLDEEQKGKWGAVATAVGDDGSNGDDDIQRVLVYVDEMHVQDGPPKKEYIGRMNRGIREAVGLGLPSDWVEKVMRKYIPEGPDAGFV
ncbi:hypothetical protein AJ80_05009 [Polytolypa hystricis UAMH7299]|uniref:gamma-glutamylcyclotransferase n=1 Tax=Polytolypa hystricis (strain UAMH7299) TaxID=1447883 RepID=A0A2B7Y7A6_POLH7|nr:hypothetical protein AJ80_05009 [Polytolypa hystricis UAMH7299]